MAKVTIYEKDQEQACGDENCCGYYYIQGRGEKVELDDETFQKLNKAVDDLVRWESLDPQDFGIVTTLDNIGYVSGD